MKRRSFIAGGLALTTLRPVGVSGLVPAGLSSQSEGGEYDLQYARMDHQHKLFDEWELLTYGTGWSDLGSTTPPARYCKSGNLILFEMSVQNTDPTNNSTVGNLPVGYRPNNTERFLGWLDGLPLASPVVGANGVEVTINPNGNIDASFNGNLLHTLLATNYQLHCLSCLFRTD